MNDFQQFTDNYLNKQAIQLKKFYGQRDDFERNKTIFGEALLKKVMEKIKILSYDGQAIPQAEMEQMQQEAVLESAVSEVYESLVKYEN